MSKSNAFKYVFISSLFSTAILFTSGNTVQVFMEYLGCSAGEISVYSSVIQIAQILVMFACAFLGDKIKKVRNMK